ncbi:5-oxoprolinase subunit PxpB [Bacillus testis]|uniref:5-oxoprolinase subunit PxpB n=1 Tax=Bacillus testis TaxID=1622072 RepID=UPI00067F005A|nr:5-oxoprolinase subunit PxpB [Bacillus testis]
MDYQLYPLGDQALLIEFGDKIHMDNYTCVQQVSSLLDTLKPDWLIEYIPAYTTLTLIYDPLLLWKRSKASPYRFLCQEINQLLSEVSAQEMNEKRTVMIPVCYGGECGPDLAFVADYHGLTEEEVIHIHSSGDYLVYMLGFAPGFPYVGGMSGEIATPRKRSPRVKIPVGSVGIAGGQTGIYPIETPGGWQLIGRTPLQLFNVKINPPTLLQAGDKVCFQPISSEEYLNLGGVEHAHHS